MFNHRPLVLASKSPRRSQLLREAGFEFTVRALEVEEDYPADLPTEAVAEFLARKKARAGAPSLSEQEILLAADSIVVLDGTIYGKPPDYEAALRTLRALSGRTHIVYTGVCLLSREKEVSFTGISHVTFAPITDAEIDYYLRTFHPYDKAGAYGVQDWIGLCKVARLEGTYANVMGLPVDLVYAGLQEFG